MSNLIKVFLLFFLISLQASGDEISYFSKGIDYWKDKGKKN